MRRTRTRSADTLYNPPMLRMMVVTAHPDDEASSFGGTLRLYQERGVETSIICLTPGQAATHRGGARSDQELAAIRRQEFAAACAMLKVSDATVLDYPDGQLHRVDPVRVVGDLTLRLRQFRPHILLTFDLSGGATGHTDHTMASVFATLAFHWAGRSNRFPDQLSAALTPHLVQKLYYSTADFHLSGREPVALAPVTAVIEIGERLETKIEAFRAHASQQPLWSLFEEYVRKRGRRELFHLAATAKIQPLAAESDLLAGVEDI